MIEKPNDVQNKVDNAILQELLHVSVRLPLLCCLVHANGLLQCLDEGESQQQRRN